MQRSRRVFPPSGPGVCFCGCCRSCSCVCAAPSCEGPCGVGKKEQGEQAHEGVMVGWRTRRLEGTGRQAGRCHACSRGKEEEGKKQKTQLNITPVTTIFLKMKKKSIWICPRQNQKGRQKSPRCKNIHIYARWVHIYV